MFNTLYKKFTSLYIGVITSIAFLPTVIAIALTALAFLLLNFEDVERTKFLIDNIPELVINNPETARTILSVLIGGIISLTVFSFSMVMLLLNQASSNYSPRLLPGLISNRVNQVILGFYIGVILFNIITMISITPSGDKYTLNGFTIVVGITLGVICLGLFVYFTHNISTNIQIGTILNNTYNETASQIGRLVDSEVQDDINEAERFVPVDSLRCDEAAYYHGVNASGILSLLSKYEVNMEVTAYKGEYILPHTELCMLDKRLDQDVKNELKKYLIFTKKQKAVDNYIMGITHITEVGIKAMSPAVNDPGTAALTIDYMAELLAKCMQLFQHEIRQTSNEKFRIIYNTMPFKELLYKTMSAYRQYCKHDAVIMSKLVNLLLYLLHQPSQISHYHDDIKLELKAIQGDIIDHISNQVDREKLIQLIAEKSS